MYLFVDIETSDLIKTSELDGIILKNYPYIVSLSWLITDSNNLLKESKSYIVYPSNYSISNEVEKIHGISYEKAKREGVKIIDVLNDLNQAIIKSELVICHNCEFDLDIINAEFRRNSIDSLFDTIDSFCTMKNSVKYFDNYNRKYPKLEELYQKVFNKKLEGTHNSYIDALATREIFFELLKVKIFKPEIVIREFIITKNKKEVEVVEMFPFRKGKKWGFCDKYKNIIIETQFESSEVVSKFLYGVGIELSITTHLIKRKQNGFTKPFESETSFIHFNNGYSFIKVNGKYGIIDEMGNVLHRFTLDYYSISNFTNGMAVVKKDISNMGEFNTDYLSNVPSSLALEMFEEGYDKYKESKKFRYGYINLKGKEVIPVIYDDARSFSNFVAPVLFKGNWIFINKDGEKVNDMFFDDINNLTSKKFLCKKNNLYGLYDDKAEEILPLKYMKIINYANNYFLLYEEERFCIFNLQSKKFLFLDYEDFKIEKLNLIVKKNGKYGYINFNGAKITDCIFDQAFPFNENLAIVRLEEKWLLLTEGGSVTKLLSVDRNYLNYPEDTENSNVYFSEGLLRVVINNKFGFINKLGDLIIPCIFDNAFNFNEGLACVEINNKFGFINKFGHVIIEIKYDSFAFDLTTRSWLIPTWKNHIMPVYGYSKSDSEYGDLIGYIDKNGTEYWENEQYTAFPELNSTSNQSINKEFLNNNFFDDEITDDLPF